MASPFAKRHRCRISVKCHCLLPAKPKFFPCCGWYCRTCEGRIDNGPRVRPTATKEPTP